MGERPLEVAIGAIHQKHRQGHSWSQRVKEAVVDLGEEEGLRLLDVIGGAIKQRECPVDEILAALGPGVDL